MVDSTRGRAWNVHWGEKGGRGKLGNQGKSGEKDHMVVAMIVGAD